MQQPVRRRRSKSATGQPARLRATKSPSRQPAQPRAGKDQPRREILTLKIKLAWGGPWRATIEIPTSATLQDLHSVIQRAVDFSDDHLFTFYIAKTWRARQQVMLEDDGGQVRSWMTLAEIFPLRGGDKLFYWFDFGDDWKFSIEPTRAAPGSPEKGVKYPRIIETHGTPPEQYPDVE